MKKKKFSRKPIPLNIVFLGIQGSGKGTQAGLLAKRLRIPIVPVGDLYRTEIARGTPLGKRAQSYISRGRLAPNVLTNELVRKHLQTIPHKRGVILDGYPRNLVQARALSRILQIRAAIHLEIPESMVMERLIGRRVCGKCGATYHIRWARPKRSGVCDRCGGGLRRRADDTPEAIRKRIALFRTGTRPIIDYYGKGGALLAVDGAHSIPVVHRELIHRLKGAWV
ncbi:MAG: nucleoside monophosphate kinase [Patescibacteria group bacterium]